MKSTIAIILLALVSFTVCAGELWILLESQELNNQFAKHLKEQGVNVRLGEGGKIFYSINQRNKVNRLAKEFIGNDIPSDRATTFTNPEAKNIFISKLKELGVPYVIKVRNGADWVVWADGYIKEVLIARKAIELFNNKEREAWLNGRGKL